MRQAAPRGSTGQGVLPLERGSLPRRSGHERSRGEVAQGGHGVGRNPGSWKRCGPTAEGWVPDASPAPPGYLSTGTSRAITVALGADQWEMFQVPSRRNSPAWTLQDEGNDRAEAPPDPPAWEARPLGRRSVDIIPGIHQSEDRGISTATLAPAAAAL